MNRTILTVSAFDASGATGVAADLKTFQAFRVYGTAAVTAVLAKNTVGIQAYHPVPMDILGQQLEAIATDIPLHGVKIGLLPGTPQIEMVAHLVEAYKLHQSLVLAPRLSLIPGSCLLDGDGLTAFKRLLVPQALLVVVNAEDAERITDHPVKDVQGAKEAAAVLVGMGAKGAVVTGGHLEGPRAIDAWFDGAHHHLFDAPRLATRNTLGMGETFSSILCALCAKGTPVGAGIEKAKQYLAKAMQHPFQIGRGAGPLNHTVPM